MTKPPDRRRWPCWSPARILPRCGLDVERYRWLRERAVPVQGSEIWYQGDYVDLRVNIGLGHTREDAEPGE